MNIRKVDIAAAFAMFAETFSFEPASTEHTGNVRSEITKDKLDRLT